MREKVYIEEAGCNRRRLDLERIRSYLDINGYILVNRPELADRILISTCAFKKKEEDASVARIEALRRYAGKTVVFGCLPDIAPRRFAELGPLPKVAPREIEKIEEHFTGGQQAFDNISDAHLLPHGRSLPRLRSLRQNFVTGQMGGALDARDFLHQTLVAGSQRLKAMLQKAPEYYYLLVCRGCLGKCSYCAIRRSIGTVKSKPVADVCQDVAEGYAMGYRDFVILGDDPGCYGSDIGSSFAELLDALAAHSEQLAAAETGDNRRSASWLHLKEVHPKFLISNTDALLAGKGTARIKSLLCPIQSGSDRILDLMGREHGMAELKSSLQALQRRFSGLTLSTQLIVGFPTETDEDFHMSLAAVRDCGYRSVTVFPYDDKEGTGASLLPGKIQGKVIRQRLREAFRYLRTHKIEAYYNCPP